MRPTYALLYSGYCDVCEMRNRNPLTFSQFLALLRLVHRVGGRLSRADAAARASIPT